MKKQLFYVVIFLLGIQLHAQELTGAQVLEKSIAFHDPDGKWKGFQGSFVVTMTTPNQPKRKSIITIDLPNELFQVSASRAANTTFYGIEKDSCTVLFNGKSSFTEEEIKKYGLTCDRAQLYKDYYTYLYGLPMKLKDPGTIIAPKVEKKIFQGKEYYMITVTYSKEVGSDIWYFYFDPATYALEIYQFLKNGKPGSGEYILLTDLEPIEDILMPKHRAWYYNSNDDYLGTDSLSKQ